MRTMQSRSRLDASYETRMNRPVAPVIRALSFVDAAGGSADLHRGRGASTADRRAVWMPSSTSTSSDRGIGHGGRETDLVAFLRTL